MLLRKSILICVAAITLCLAGTTLGKAFIQELVSEDEQILGQSIINYVGNSDQTECIVICWDLEPEADYTVLLCDCDEYGQVTSICILCDLTTNKVGNSCIFALLEGDFSDWCIVVGVEGPDGLVTPCAVDEKIDDFANLDLEKLLNPDIPESPRPSPS